MRDLGHRRAAAEGEEPQGGPPERMPALGAPALSPLATPRRQRAGRKHANVGLRNAESKVAFASCAAHEVLCCAALCMFRMRCEYKFK